MEGKPDNAFVAAWRVPVCKMSQNFIKIPLVVQGGELHISVAFVAFPTLKFSFPKNVLEA